MDDAHHATGGAPPTQDGHSLAIETPLGKDVLLLTALDGVEEVSRGFVYTIEMLTLAADSAVRSLVGNPVTLWLRNDNAQERRPLHGHIRKLTRVARDSRGYWLWRAEVAPWLWFLGHSRDCRIFQNLPIPEIVRSVLDDHGLTDYELRLHAQYPKLEFVVQDPGESALAFVSRLLEHAGIFYAFEHFAERHLLVLSDYSTHAKFTTPREATIDVNADLGEIQEFEHSYTFRAGNWALCDFDFEHPTKNLHTREATVLDIGPMKRFEIFDYPGHYLERDKGADLTRLRVEQEEAQHHRVSGSGHYVGFDAGKRFILVPDRDNQAAKPQPYFLTEVRHSARETHYFATGEEPAHYSNRFTAIPATVPFRPERLTAKPVVQGPQTATVVGPAGENIHTDQYGRIRVLFHWDRRGKRDEHASCWIRVSQVSAGSRWGSLAIPHVGQEVIVEFLEGDPDRPIVTGHVHNGTNMPPIPLPEHKNKTIMRDHGDNKIIMHGKAGKQYMSMVSPRSLNLVAVRSAAKSLSAASSYAFQSKNYAINEAIPSFKDPNSLEELYYVFEALENGTPDQNSTNDKMAKTAPNILPSQSGAANSGASIDINSVSEGNINGLSFANTNAWVYGDSNAWVGNGVNTQVNGNATVVIGGTAFGGTSTTSVNSTEVWGDNITYAHHDNITTADHDNITNVPNGENGTYVNGTNLTQVSGDNTTFVVGSNWTIVTPNNFQVINGANTSITFGLNTALTIGVNIAVNAILSLAQSGIAIGQNMIQSQTAIYDLQEKDAKITTVGAAIEAGGLKMFL